MFVVVGREVVGFFDERGCVAMGIIGRCGVVRGFYMVLVRRWVVMLV